MWYTERGDTTPRHPHQDTDTKTPTTGCTKYWQVEMCLWQVHMCLWQCSLHLPPTRDESIIQQYIKETKEMWTQPINPSQATTLGSNNYLTDHNPGVRNS